jgi:BMFP domain-containing protein YqiC
LKADVRRIETIVEDVETRVKEDSRENERDLKATIDSIESDMETLEDKINTSMKELQESIDKQIKTTLANPLTQMK